jgi:hypothetical protein
MSNHLLCQEVLEGGEGREGRASCGGKVDRAGEEEEWRRRDVV